MGDDCFRNSPGAPFAGMAESNCAGMESMGECSGVWVECDDVLRGLRESMGYG